MFVFFQSVNFYHINFSPLISSQRYELLHVLNFDPVRRRMSVIVRSKSGEHVITGRFIALTFVCLSVFSPDHLVCVCVRSHSFPQVIHCSSVKEQILPSSPVSDRRKWTGYACTLSVTLRCVKHVTSLSTSSGFYCCFPGYIYIILYLYMSLLHDRCSYEKALTLKQMHQALPIVTLSNVCCLAQEGYRTLCVAYKQLSAEEYAQADAGLREARLALQDREEKLMAVYNQVETGMSLIGATAVEDRWALTHSPSLCC